MAKLHNDEFKREAVRMAHSTEKTLTKRSEKSYNDQIKCPRANSTLQPKRWFWALFPRRFTAKLNDKLTATRAFVGGRDEADVSRGSVQIRMLGG